MGIILVELSIELRFVAVASVVSLIEVGNIIRIIVIQLRVALSGSMLMRINGIFVWRIE